LRVTARKFIKKRKEERERLYGDAERIYAERIKGKISDGVQTASQHISRMTVADATQTSTTFGGQYAALANTPPQPIPATFRSPRSVVDGPGMAPLYSGLQSISAAHYEYNPQQVHVPQNPTKYNNVSEQPPSTATPYPPIQQSYPYAHNPPHPYQQQNSAHQPFQQPYHAIYSFNHSQNPQHPPIAQYPPYFTPQPTNYLYQQQNTTPPTQVAYGERPNYPAQQQVQQPTLYSHDNTQTRPSLLD
jgi:hypothetical protein